MIRISPALQALAGQAENDLQQVFQGIRDVSFRNTARVMDAFANHKVSEPCFHPTTGY